MARYVSAANGNWSTAATWNQVTNTPTIAATNTVNVSAGGITSAAFTAPNTTNAATGVRFYLTANGSTGSLVATLQEDAGAGFVDTACTVTVSRTDIAVLNTYYYFRPVTPYVFTTIVANKYRWKLNLSGATGTWTVATDSGGSNFSYYSTDDRTVSPTTNDDAVVIGHNGATAITVTMDGTFGFGSGTDTTVFAANMRSVGHALAIDNNGIVLGDTSADVTPTVKGSIYCHNGGELRVGSTGTPYPSARTFNLLMDQNGTGGNFGIGVSGTGKLVLQGSPMTNTTDWKTMYVSGTGTAASPLVVSTAVDWSVGDEIAITSTGAYNEHERRFIITKNSATSYVLSNTSGGAENALSFSHTTDAHVMNIRRNIIVGTTNSSHGLYIHNYSATLGYFDLDWVRFNYMGSTVSNKSGLYFSRSTGNVGSGDYLVSVDPVGSAYVWDTSKEMVTHIGLVSVGQLSTGTPTQLSITAGSANRTLNDCFVIGCQRTGAGVASSSSITFNRLHVIGFNEDNTTSAAGMTFTTAGNINVNDSEVQCGRQNDLISTSLTDATFTNCELSSFGTVNTDALELATDTYNTILFTNCYFGATNLITNYANQATGSLARFHKYQQTDNRHRWYTINGQGLSTGAGLDDTTVKTAGSLAVRLAPETSTGFSLRFKILSRPDTAVSVLGFSRMNAAFAGDASASLIVNLFLPGSSIADATQTVSKVADTWQVFSLAANYTGDVNAYATVVITASTTTSAAYAYVDDLYNGTNAITALDVWDEGQPSPIMFEQLGDSAAIWAVPKNTMTTAGTIGEHVAKQISTKKVPEY